MKKIKFLIGILIFTLIACFVGGYDIFYNMEMRVEDFFYQKEQVLDGNICIIGIDAESLEEMGPFHTWTRADMADVISILNQDPENAPAVIGVDIMYFGETDEANDMYLAETAAENDNVVVANLVNFDTAIEESDTGDFYLNTNHIYKFEEPYEALKKNTRQGHVNTIADKDGVIRNGIYKIDVDGKPVYSLSYEVYRKYMEYNKNSDLIIPPANKNGEWFIPYSAKCGGFFDGYSISKVINGEISPEMFAGKIVLIGPYATGLLDEYNTPIDYSSKMFGVEIHANMINAFLNNNFRTYIPIVPQIVFLAVVLLICCILFYRLKPKQALLILISVLLGYSGIVYILYCSGYMVKLLYLPIFVTAGYIIILGIRYAITLIEKRKIENVYKKIKLELDIAQKIQVSALPRNFEKFGIEVFATMKPAKEVGGDFYDIFKIDDTHICITIADVSGKGISAALFMLMAKITIKNYAKLNIPLNEVLEKANQELCENNDANMFVTVFSGILNTETGEFVFANAGHNKPLIYNQEKNEFEWFNVKSGFVLAGMDDMRYVCNSMTLSKGDIVFMYTDGVTEAQNSESELFSDDRLINTFNENKYAEKSIKEILADMEVKIAEFENGAEQADDRTMIAFRM